MRYVIGIDEVGRGPLAGPVVLCAAAIPVSWSPRLRQGFGGQARKYMALKDSKALTAIQREKWSAYLISHPKIVFALTKAHPKTIDEVNIAEAANRAARKAFNKVASSLWAHSHELAGVYLDGGLYLRKLRHPRKRAAKYTEEVFFKAKRQSVTASTLIKGDEKVAVIKIASILAKVHRDGLMARLARKHPGYGFERHKGYGTKAHYEAIRTLGITKAHRLTFVG